MEKGKGGKGKGDGEKGNEQKEGRGEGEGKGGILCSCDFSLGHHKFLLSRIRLLELLRRVSRDYEMLYTGAVASGCVPTQLPPAEWTRLHDSLVHLLRTQSESDRRPCSTCSVLQPFSIRGLATPWTYFLHLSLSSVIPIDCSTGSRVHVLMLSIQAVHERSVYFTVMPSVL